MAKLRAQEDALREAQQQQQGNAAQLAQRDAKIASLREQALTLEKECAFASSPHLNNVHLSLCFQS